MRKNLFAFDKALVTMVSEATSTGVFVTSSQLGGESEFSDCNTNPTVLAGHEITTLFPAAFCGPVMPFMISVEPRSMETCSSAAFAVPHLSGILLGNPAPLELSFQVYTVVWEESLLLSLSRKLKSSPKVPPPGGRSGS